MNINEHLNLIKTEIEKNFLHSFINRINMPSKCDLVLSFSKGKTKSLLLSLNSNIPFIDVVNFKNNNSINNPFLNKIKPRLLNAFLESVNILNEDNIISLNFIKTNDTYDKIKFSLVFEIFKANANIIFINEENIIIDAFRFRGLDTKRPILNNLNYVLPIKRELKEFKDEEKIFLYEENLNKFYLNEKYGSLISSIKRKIKSLNIKLDKLNIEKENDLKHLIYKDYGDFILSNLDQINKGDSSFKYFDDILVPLKEEFSPIENSQHFYKLYKKSKTSLVLIDKYIEETKENIAYLESLLTLSLNYEESDYLDLINELEETKLIQVKLKKPQNIKKNLLKVHYFIKNGVKIAYGKNAQQNSYLTFKLANTHDKFLHIKDSHGSHIVIFSSSPSNEVIECAAELALFLANKKDGEVYYTEIKNVKKTKTLGRVNLLSYETFYIKKFKNDIFKLVDESSLL